jgi:two-component system response regulator YesN
MERSDLRPLTGPIPRVDYRSAILDLAEHYSAATGIGCAAVTPDGRRITPDSGADQAAAGGPPARRQRCRVCAELNRLQPDRKIDCADVRRYGTYQAERFGGVYIYFCPRNMTHWAVPIRVAGLTLAALVGGPVLMIDPEEFLAEDILASFPVPPEGVERLRRACREIPYVGTARVRSLAEILKCGTDALSRRLEMECEVGAKTAAAPVPTLPDPDAGAASQGYPIAKERELLFSIAKGDLDGARKTLNEILGVIFFYSKNNLERIKLRVEELVVLLSRAAVEGGASIEEIIGLNDDYLVRIRRSGSVYDLSASLAVILSRFVDCVFTLQSIKHADLIRRSVFYIRSEYANPLSLEKVAEYVHLSPSHFSRIFHDGTGESFVAYLTRIRIEKGKSLLKDSSIPLAEIGTSIGFKDQSYFSRVFKRGTGMSPGKYRALQSPNAIRKRIDESNIEIHET